MFKNSYDIKLAPSVQRQNSRKAKRQHQIDVEKENVKKYGHEKPWERGIAWSEGKKLPSDDEKSDFDPEGDHGIGDLHLAARLGNLNRVRQLIEGAGENVNKTKWSGVTALHRAAAEGHSKVVEYLVTKAKCDVNCKTTFGWHTPLHFAARNGREEACMVLIDNGATWQVFNKDRETPQKWARAGGHANMGRKLEQLVNQQASKHRKAKVQEMEKMYKEKRRRQQEEREREEEDERKREEEEERKQANYKNALEGGGATTNWGDEVQFNEEDFAQLPVNLPKIEYVRRGRKQVFIYNKLIDRSRIVQKKRYGAESENPSTYVTRNRVNMPGVTDTKIQAVGELSRHFRKTRQTRAKRATLSPQLSATT